MLSFSPCLISSRHPETKNFENNKVSGVSGHFLKIIYINKNQRTKWRQDMLWETQTSLEDLMIGLTDGRTDDENKVIIKCKKSPHPSTVRRPINEKNLTFFSLFHPSSCLKSLGLRSLILERAFPVLRWITNTLGYDVSRQLLKVKGTVPHSRHCSRGNTAKKCLTFKEFKFKRIIIA